MWSKRRIEVEEMSMKQLSACLQLILTHLQLEAIAEESYRDGEVIKLVPLGTDIDAEDEDA